MENIHNGAEEEPDFYTELKEAAWNILHENPGTDCGEWMNMLVEQYPSEVVDALGNIPDEVYCDLADLWESDYCDPATDIEQKFSEWAECFCNESTVGSYYYLVDSCQKLKKFNLK